MTLVQVDGGHTVLPSSAKSIGVLYPGERADAIVEWTSNDHEASIVIELDDENFRFPNPALQPLQSFPVTVTGVSSPASNTVASIISDQINLQTVASPVETIPQFPADDFPPSEQSTFVIYTTTMKLAKHHNIPMGFINRTSWSEQSSPPGALISLPRDQWDKKQLVPLINVSSDNHEGPNSDLSFNNSNDWITLVINNLDDGGHPFHLHGYSFYVISIYPHPLEHSQAPLSGGSTSYNYNPFKKPIWESPAGTYNTENPARKDTVFVPRRGYVVIRFKPDNLGIWMFHCHVGWHLGSGMAMAWEVR